MLKIGLASLEDPKSPNAFSGITFRLIKLLREEGAEVLPLGPLEFKPSAFDRFYGNFLKRRGKNYWPEYTARAYKTYAATLRERIGSHTLDCILARSTPPVSGFNSPVPLAIWNDATFSQVLGQYRGFDGVSRFERNTRHKAEGKTLRSASRVIFTSRWAVDSAINDYGVSPSKTVVIPIGANRDAALSLPQLQQLNAARDFSVCRLLFIGVDWHRKGGDRFLALVKELLALGVPVQGDMVGAWPPAHQVVPSCVRCHGSLPFSDPSSATVFSELFRNASFLILPSRIDCTPVVVAEAFSQGLPAVTSAVGGLPEMIESGKTGFSTNFEANPSDAVKASASWIAETFRNPSVWIECSQRCHAVQVASMSWPAHARHLIKVLENMSLKP